MKLCKDCKHFDARSRCIRVQHIEPVMGKLIIDSYPAYDERLFKRGIPAFNSPDPCGPIGKHWEALPPKPIEPPATPPLPWWRKLLGTPKTHPKTP